MPVRAVRQSRLKRTRPLAPPFNCTVVPEEPPSDPAPLALAVWRTKRRSARYWSSRFAPIASTAAGLVPSWFQRTRTQDDARGAPSLLSSRLLRRCVGLRRDASARGPITNQLLCL